MDCLLLCAALFSVVWGAEQLKLSVLVFRHGDRSAISVIPNDIYNVSSWPQGPGQLSEVGVEQHLANGKYLRDRYMNKKNPTYLSLNEDYKRVEVHVRSTDKDRTLMSAESMLAGLFPPTEEADNKTEPLDVWQPIPVHTLPLNDETMLGGGPSGCDPFDEHLKEILTADPVFATFMANNSDVAKKILRVTGYGEIEDAYEAFEHLTRIYDTLFCENATGMPFKKDYVKENIFELSTRFGEMEWIKFGLMSRQLKRMVGGVLLSDLKQRVKDAINGSSPLKLILYSAHDTTLAGLLTVFGVYDQIQPPYATVLMLELWEGEGGKWEVRLNRHHGTDEMVTYQLPGCSSTGCTPDQFYSVNTDYDYSEKEFLEYCRGTEILPGVSKSALFIMLIVALLVFISTTITLLAYVVSLYKKTDGGVCYERNMIKGLLDDEAEE